MDLKIKFDLEERTLRFGKEIIRICKRLPYDAINKELISRLVRSGGSIGANYREANDALSKKDFTHRIKISRMETKETDYWLELIKEANPDFSEEIGKLIKETEELRKIFSAIIRKCT